MATLGVSFDVVPAALDESVIVGRGGSVEDIVVELALAKAGAVDAPGSRVLGADTMVTCEGQLLGKPVDAADGERMLRLQSGRVVDVVTGVALAAPRLATTAPRLSPARCIMLAIPDEAIHGYVASRAGEDKAGGMDIQGEAAAFVARIEGSYTNVMGLPLDVIGPWVS